MLPGDRRKLCGTARRVKGHTLFETSIVLPQLRLFDLGEALGEEGWVKFLKLDEYAPRQPRHPDELQQVLFPYAEALWRAGERFDASGTPDSGEVAR